MWMVWVLVLRQQQGARVQRVWIVVDHRRLLLMLSDARSSSLLSLRGPSSSLDRYDERGKRQSCYLD